MKIWIDADACPVLIKAVLFRAAKRTQTMSILVANTPLNIQPSPFIKAICVKRGFDSADDYIVCHMEPHDLVVTADIPLASQVVDKLGVALNPRGELYTQNNIRQCLALRDIKETLRGSGVNVTGPAVFNHKDVKAFANALDIILTKAKN